MSTWSATQFILNNELIRAEVAPMLSALDYLRDHLHLTGTKEGCKMGDCGTCNVLVGELSDSGLNYQPMTACLIPMGELAGKHLATIEGVSGKQLTAVQAALHDCAASQCGYCTPGFVIALTAWVLNPTRQLDADGLDDALSGNLCRCTGYRSIKQAARQIASQLQALDLNTDRIALLCKHFALPDYFMGIETRLRQLETMPSPSTTPALTDTHVAGATDLFIQNAGDVHTIQPRFLVPDSKHRRVQIIDRQIIIDSCISFEEFFNHSIIKELLPDIYAYRKQIASWPVRCRATLAGNLCNASPIADLICLLLALDAMIDLSGSHGQRSIPLCTFYLGYKQLNKAPDEIITTIRIPILEDYMRMNWIKVSKRFSLDMATLCSALKIELNGKHIVNANLVFGGIAEIPLSLEKTNRFLKGKTISLDTVLAVAEMAQTEISPISDIRGSASYRRLLVRQIIIAHFLRLFPEHFDEDSLYEALR